MKAVSLKKNYTIFGVVLAKNMQNVIIIGKNTSNFYIKGESEKIFVPFYCIFIIQCWLQKGLYNYKIKHTSKSMIHVP